MNKKQKKNLCRILISAALLAVILILQRVLPISEWIVKLLLLIPYLIIGADVLKKAVLGIIHGHVFDENFLMAVATIGAIALGENTESVAVMLFYQVGELFQSVAVDRSRKNIAGLMDIRPDYANLEQEGELVRVDPDEVEVGSLIVVKPGERIPLDGVIEEGQTSLNTSALTGESLPRDAKAGDEVISGCVNITGLIRVRTTKGFEESTVSRILELVENSSMKKAKAENFITKFARYYTPIVCFSALALAVLPPVIRLMLSLPPEWAAWITRALTFLVISCPCALVISIPLSFFGGIGGASSRGILVKGANYMEVLARVKTVVFDKTGTLTEGVFEVTEIHPAEGVSEEHLLTAAALSESCSDHPISKSIRKAYGKSIDPGRVQKGEETGGHGVSALVDGRKVAAGNQRLMEKLGISPAEVQGVGTIVHVAEEGSYLGYLLISDRIKKGAAEAVRKLEKEGITKIVMLTGDEKRVAMGVAEQLHITEVRSQLLPEDKVREVESLLSEEKGKDTLAFAGDGVNDAPVLSRADLGIAMGAMGSDAAIEAADVVLMDDDPGKIALAKRIAVRTLRIVYENIAFAIGIKILFLILGALGFIGMWWAIFADVGVMILAVLNAVRTLFIKERA